MSNVLENLLRYVVINTRSDENSETTPSTASQMDLARLLQTELEELGFLLKRKTELARNNRKILWLRWVLFR